jgi:hypothetical protein
MNRLPKAGCRALMIIAMLLAGAVSPAAAEEATEMQIALDLATMLRSARAVIAENQALINDPAVGDKGLSGPLVQARALEKFRATKIESPEDISTTSRHGRLLKAQIDAIAKVMDDNQASINQKGVGFKGFVPAVFARLVNEEFRDTMGDEAEVKVTAPPNLVRNRKARPDEWETAAIRTKFSAADWKKGDVFSAVADNRGRDAFRVLVPEYYGQGCLVCHGAPKGELDVTGYPKEGGELGDLGGVISVTIYRR